MNTEQLLPEMPFYYLTDYDFIDNLSIHNVPVMKCMRTVISIILFWQ